MDVEGFGRECAGARSTRPVSGNEMAPEPGVLGPKQGLADPLVVRADDQQLYFQSGGDERLSPIDTPPTFEVYISGGARLLAYVSPGSAQTPAPGIYTTTLGADGWLTQRLLSGTEYASPVSTADGSSLAAVKAGHQLDIIRTENPHRVVAAELATAAPLNSKSQPAFSSNGERLTINTSSAVLIVSARDGRIERRIDVVGASPATWANSNTIGYVLVGETSPGLYTHEVDSQRDERVVRPSAKGAILGIPAWSPSGRFIAFRSLESWQEGAAASEALCVLDLTDNRLVMVATGLLEGGFSWANRSDELIVNVDNGSASGEILVCNPLGAEACARHPASLTESLRISGPIGTISSLPGERP